MIRSLYTASTGMVHQMNRMDVITNNMANSDTTAYKKEGSTSQSFDAVYGIKINDSSVNYIHQNIGKMSLGVKVGETYTDYSDGNLEETGQSFDVALAGKGFFAISYADKNGNESVRYTRDGNFVLNKDGILMTRDGDFVLGGDNEIIVIPEGETMNIDEMGRISAGGQVIGNLDLVDFEDYNYLKKFGENMYTTVDGAVEIPATCKVYQGYLEASNVNVISEMVELISVTRDYESNQKVIQSVDSSLEKSVSLGRIR
ncbi:MAG: flagellar hook-basal body protein [Butyrivibrio sp.]|nr:flagellar hook-basal body protein [Butyrivibrio sp.]